MNVIETDLEGCFILEPKIFEDARGYFHETYNLRSFNHKLKSEIKFVQENESMSSKGVLRGLHYQKDQYAQAKLVRVVKGKVLDVTVDIREKSSTFGKYITVELSEENKRQLFVPRGFAHGFVVLENETIFNYKCDNFYNKSSEAGIIFNDPILNIDWKLPENDLIVSEKDLVLPKFENAVYQ